MNVKTKNVSSYKWKIVIGFAREPTELPRLVQIDVGGERHVGDNERYVGDGQMKQIALRHVV